MSIAKAEYPIDIFSLIRLEHSAKSNFLYLSIMVFVFYLSATVYVRNQVDSEIRLAKRGFLHQQ